MPETGTSGSMSGMWKRSMVRLVRHRQTKGPATDRPNLTHRATSRLHHLDSTDWARELSPTDATEPLGVCREASVSSSQLKPRACIKVVHNRRLSHESVVNPLVVDFGRFGSPVSVVVIENELPTN